MVILRTGSVSWFEVNGYGCKPTYPMNITSEDPYRPVRPERVDGCLLDYHILEIGHSGVQCALALFGLFGAICLGHTYLDEDDSFFPCPNMIQARGACNYQRYHSDSELIFNHEG
ncbi:hypothetical protein pipiens_009255, partial [Culex pipiens pipiens]